MTCCTWSGFLASWPVDREKCGWPNEREISNYGFDGLNVVLLNLAKSFKMIYTGCGLVRAPTSCFCPSLLNTQAISKI